MRREGAPRPLKAIVTVPWGVRGGGAETMLATFLRHLDRSRVEPIVAFLSPGAFVREVADLGIRTAVLPSSRLRDVPAFVRTARTLATLLRAERPDVLLGWSPKMHLYGAAAMVLARTATTVVWWQHGVPGGRWLDCLATLLPARAIGCSSFESARAQRKLRPLRSVFVVHPGIDPPAPLDASETAALRRRLALPNGQAIIGIVGRLQPWKGQHLVIEAVAKLRTRGHDTHCLVVGGDAFDLSPWYPAHLRELTHALGVSDSVTLTGQVSDVGPYIEVMDVLVNASSTEPFGIVLLEAMSRGVPVVSFASGGPREIIEHDVSGLLVAGESSLSLATALERLLGCERLRTRLGKRGRSRCLEVFSAARMTQSLTDELERIHHEA
jgi:glycosyltransferase involved in cell wall biosynthesis